MKMLIAYKKIPDRIYLHDDRFISRTILAEVLTKRDPFGDGRTFSKQIVSLWMKSGRWPLELIPVIRKIKLAEVQAPIVRTRYGKGKIPKRS